MCNKKIKPFTTRQDYENRHMHLKCWKEKNKSIAIDCMAEAYAEGQKKN